MSKQVAVLSREDVAKVALVEANGRSMGQVKADTGCRYIINSWFYNMATGRPTGNLKINGEVKADAGWASYGLAWDGGADIRMDLVPAQGNQNYISGVELLTPYRGPEDGLSYSPEYGGRRGRSAVLLAGRRLILYCTGDGTGDAQTPEELRDALVSIGCQYDTADNLRALGLDSGGSSQCNFAGESIYSARRVAGYLCVWTKEAGKAPEKEDSMSEKKIVCLDPGHGPDTVNGSPDGSYKEKEFCWDMYTRVKPLLEARGMTVVGTRTENEKPSLTARAETSNQAGADCFVSLHSNAAGNGGWYDARGLMVYTSAGPMTAQRNVLAQDLIDAFRAAGVLVRSSPILHELYTVLAKTEAPACLIEYGFHTSREDVALLTDGAYRDKLAQATAKGICAWLGVPWGENPDTPDAPAGDAEEGAGDDVAAWAAEAWQKAKDKGVLDGTRPLDPVTRQELAVVLDRLWLLD